MNLISFYDDTAQATCNGNPEVYEDIEFITTAIPQVTLDNAELDYNKSLRLIEIDVKTNQLIGQGFAFDSKQFSLSLEAQTQWTTIKTNASDFTFPMGISTINSEEYSLTEANVVPFWGTGLATVKAHIDSGRALKISINAAVDQTALDAIVDGR